MLGVIGGAGPSRAVWQLWLSHHQCCLAAGTSEAGLWHQGQPVLPLAPVQPEEATDTADEVLGLPSPGPWQAFGCVLVVAAKWL